MPHWLNRSSLYKDSNFDSWKITIKGVLGKPIYVESCAEENKKWVYDVILDSKVDFDELGGHDQKALVNKKKLLLKSKKNIDNILKDILEDRSAKLCLGYRNDRLQRLHIKGDNYLIPSIDHLSTGQSVLFNLFISIIRYADQGDIYSSIKLEDIQGIVIIDEVDAHLDADLQHDVLPKILKQFPKIQFILTSHSPIFLLGMEMQYGQDGYEIVEMPNGVSISSERFSEFHKSFELLKVTKTFEEELQTKVQALLSSSNKPMVLLEGKTDLMYINKAISIFGREDILEKIEIDQVGIDVKGGSENSGSSALERIELFYKKNSRLLKHKLLLIYDCDTKKSQQNFDNLFVECIPKVEVDCAFNKGIENLLPAYLKEKPDFLGMEKRFYRESKKGDKDLRTVTIRELNKDEFCNWICNERDNADDFEKFSIIIDILDKYLNKNDLT